MNSPRLSVALAAVFVVLVLAVVPWAIEASGRYDLYYTLTSVALLSIASAGVWLTFYIGRINIGQGAFALAGGGRTDNADADALQQTIHWLEAHRGPAA